MIGLGVELRMAGNGDGIEPGKMLARVWSEIGRPKPRIATRSATRSPGSSSPPSAISHIVSGPAKRSASDSNAVTI